jgi:hypothetical protein
MAHDSPNYRHRCRPGESELAGQAMIARHAGASAEAVAIFRRLLSVPAGAAVWIARLKMDPVWDPIRNDPQFQQLLTTQNRVGL